MPAKKMEKTLIFADAHNAGINVGRNNTVLLYGCVYASCIIHEIPKTAKELTAYTEIDRTKMLNAYRMLKRNLKLNTPPIDPRDFVSRFGSRLNLKQTTMTKATEIIAKLNGTPIVAGKHPKTIVASALYLASIMNNDRRTQREITSVTGVIEFTIRRRSREMVKYLF